MALSVGKDDSLCMWDLLKGRLAFKKKLPRMADKVLFSPNGTHFAILSDFLIQIYRTKDVSLTCEIKHDKRIHTIQWYKVGNIRFSRESDIFT